MFIPWPMYLPVYSNYCIYLKEGLSQAQQYPFHLYKQLLQLQEACMCCHMCTLQAGLLPSYPLQYKCFCFISTTKEIQSASINSTSVNVILIRLVITIHWTVPVESQCNISLPLFPGQSTLTASVKCPSYSPIRFGCKNPTYFWVEFDP